MIRVIIPIVLLLAGCGYRYYAGDLKPLAEQEQLSSMTVQDDGRVVFVQERLEIGLRPMTDEELNRQFAAHPSKAINSGNPYTFGDWQEPKTGERASRFAVFHLKVKNYTYPKVLVDPLKVQITSDNGRGYHSMSLPDLNDYFLTYATGYAGNKYALYDERMDILRRTLYRGEEVFSGQEKEGYIVFPILHQDVSRIRINLAEVVLRFDFRNEPLEALDIHYAFEREVGRVYPGREGL